MSIAIFIVCIILVIMTTSSTIVSTSYIINQIRKNKAKKILAKKQELEKELEVLQTQLQTTTDQLAVMLINKRIKEIENILNKKK